MIYKNGYVALFDVLGFSDRVMRGEIDGLDRYIETVLSVTRPRKRLRTILFSDTVVLFTLDDSDNSFQEIVNASSWLLYELIGSGIPVRGALSYGDFVRTDSAEHGTVIAGRPIIDAHYFESRLQWIGMMVAPSVLNHRKELVTSAYDLKVAAKDTSGSAFREVAKRLRIQHCENVPLTESAGEPFEGFAIVPLASKAKTLEDLRDSMDDILQTLTRLKQLAPDARSQAKYRRSLDWLNHVHTNFGKLFGRGILIDALTKGR